MSVNISDSYTAEGKAFMREIQELAKLEVQIGFHSGDNVDDNGKDMSDIAAWNEFGTVNMPSRPYLRQSIDNNIDNINQFLAEKKQQVLSGGTAQQVLDDIGLFQKDLIQVEITEGSFMPNAASTVKMKSKKKTPVKPLIDTGRMLQSVNYKIKLRGT